MILIGRNFFPTISRVKATSYSSIGKDLRSIKEGRMMKRQDSHSDEGHFYRKPKL